MSSFYDDASLVMIPSGYKNAKIYCEKPTDGTGDLTFTRASNATRVASNGLIEKVRTNLVLQSEAFDNAAWTKTNATITDNATAAPDGTLTADKLVETAALGDHAVARVGGMATAGIYTLSVFAKAGERTRIAIGNSSAAHYAIFDLSLGTVVQASQGTVTNGTISSIDANGFYRVSCTITVASAASAVFNLVSTGTTISYTGDGTSGLFIWGAQLETGDIATSYIPTTTTAVSVGILSNVPRIDYTGGGCGKLLLEPQRTNLVTFSEQFDNAAWTIVSATITANATTSPDGYQNADLLTISSSSQVMSQAPSVTAGTTFVWSIYAKAGNWDIVRLGQQASSTNGAWFNLSTKTVGTVNGGTAEIIEVGNGWFRLVAKFNSWQAGGNLFIGISAANGSTTTAPIGSTMYFYGAQLETNATYATSYIPTLSTSVTRVADAASKTGISSLIGQTEGTLFVEAKITLNGRLLLIGAAGNFIEILANSAGKVNGFVRTSVTEADILSTSTYATGDTLKVAFAYKQNDFALYVNGTAQGTDTSGNVPTGMAQLIINDYLSAGFNSANAYSQAILFKTRLTNAQLAELTTL
jgi:hypothetical protein